MIRKFLIGLLVTAFALPAFATPVTVPTVYNSAGQPVGATAVITVDTTGTYVAGGGGGGGGAATIADGADVTQGAKADAAAAADTSTASLIALIKRNNQNLTTVNTTLGTLATSGNQGTANSSLSTIATNSGLAATSALQTAVQANAGSDATKAFAVQGIIGGKPLFVLPDSVTDGTAFTQSFASTGVQSGASINTAGMGMIAFSATTASETGATMVVQASPDGTNWVATQFWRTDSVSQQSVVSASQPSTSQQFVAPVTGAFMRIGMTAQTGGTLALAGVVKRAAPPLPGTVAVASTTTTPVNVNLAPSSSAGNGVTPVVTSAVASSLVVKASAGNLYSWRVTAGASAGYVLFINATSAPGDGAVTPLDCVAVAANATVGDVYTAAQRYGTGITIVFSTTGCFTKTASATAFITAAAS